MSMLAVMGTVLARDLKLAVRQRGDSLTAVGFFAIAAVLFPFGVGPEADDQREDGTGRSRRDQPSRGQKPGQEITIGREPGPAPLSIGPIPYWTAA